LERKTEEAQASHRGIEEDVSRFVVAAIGLDSIDVTVMLNVQGRREKNSATKKISDGKRADGKRKMETR
jgi:hypothetical protein